MINWINNYTRTHSGEGNYYICPGEQPVDTTPLLENAWLSGFIDADGSFDIRVALKSQKLPKNSVSARFRLEQRTHDPITGESYFNILNRISNALGVTVGTTMHNKEAAAHEYLCISLSSLKSRTVLIGYLDSFPLFTSKLMNYIDWKKCHKLMVDKLHITEEGRNQAIYLKSGMNRNRVHLNWDHLNKLSSY